VVVTPRPGHSAYRTRSSSRRSVQKSYVKDKRREMQKATSGARVGFPARLESNLGKAEAAHQWRSLTTAIPDISHDYQKTPLSHPPLTSTRRQYLPFEKAGWS